ncbi:MAG: hypothetical protein ATN34_00315 [Epulopiscium sp. Nele67-Bin002]|nr:MAG: hypothetical protein ATN34_00315 [Epulopiscium sp. Nele67-Bin002]OON98621.1 MAG: hypothetical protein ATN35_04195 [Epulopiscium sp. Nele67-Bin004]
MKLYTISYLFKEGLRGLWKNRMMAFASIATIVLSLLVLGISYSIAQNFEYIISQVEIQMGITAYVSDVFSDQEIDSLKQTVENMANVVEVEYISKDDALKILAQGDTVLYEEFKDDNPLPASLEIKVAEVAHQADIVEKLLRVEGIEIDYFEAETDMFIDLNNRIQVFSGILIALLALIALLLITNTIKLTVFVRKKEIEIMKFIGATDSFIRIPFLVEGITIGIIGAIVPMFMIFKGYEFAIQELSGAFDMIFGGISLKSVEVIMMGLLPMYTGLAIGISVVGSIIAIHRHLKV